MKKRKRNRFSQFGAWLRKSNPILFVFVLMGITAIFTFTITAPIEFGWIQDIEFRPAPLDLDMPIWMLVFTAVIAAPLYETLLFQMLPFFVLHRFATFRRNRWAIVLISAMIFGSLHYYSAMYIIATMIIGALMMYGYIVKWRRNAYWNIVLFHALWNGIAVAAKALGLE